MSGLQKLYIKYSHAKIKDWKDCLFKNYRSLKIMNVQLKILNPDSEGSLQASTYGLVKK